ncbi:MAG: hypothetical protein ACKV2T_30650 [Kofleriaceae bacterium]
MKALFFVSALVLVGCSKKESATGDPCGAAVNGAVDRMIASNKGGPPQANEIAEKLRTLMTQRCRDDKWPAEVLECYGKASDQPSMRTCRQKLPPELGQRLQMDIMKVMSAGAAGAREKAREHMGGGHGGGGGADMGGGSGGGAGGGEPAGSAAPSGSAAPAGSAN